MQRADQLARRAAQAWEPGFGAAAMARLASTQGDFMDPATPVLDRACRAERLVMALDRLLPSESDAGRRQAASACLDRLFRLVQSRGDFSPTQFARELEGFRTAMGP
jgi:hypothetical protein